MWHKMFYSNAFAIHNIKINNYLFGLVKCLQVGAKGHD